MPDRRQAILAGAAHVGRGTLMGAANIVPGVSGGTVALIFGIYERLITALSHFDLTLLGQLRRREWAAAAAHIDLRFLVALGAGVLLGTVGLASVMQTLLAYHRQQTLAVMFGLILASSLVVFRMIRARSAGQRVGVLGAGLLAAAAAYWLVDQPMLQPRPGLIYLFVCGAIAICAMILPGISGAFVLLVMGNYVTVTGAIRDLTSPAASGESVVILSVFAAGCAIGLISFSKFLRWVLARYHALTMAVLCGLMLGSLRRIWPFQIDQTPDLPLKEKIFINRWPAAWDGPTSLSVAGAFLAAVVVLAIDRHARLQQRGSAAEAPDGNRSHPGKKVAGR